MDFKDDAWTVHYDHGGVVVGGSAQFFAPPSYTIGAAVYEAFLGDPGAPGGARYHIYHHQIGFDIGPSLAGALDNVFLIRVSGDIFQKNQSDGFLVFGTQTAAADMPTTGSATFAGLTRGVYLDAQGRYFDTSGKLGMTANFATGAVNGQATEISKNGGSYCLCVSNDNIDFSFAGAINAGASTFTASASGLPGSLGLSGSVEGAFYGAPGAAPDEVGLAYQLGQPGGVFMAGGGLMAKQ